MVSPRGFLVLLFLFPAIALADERILSWHSDILVRSDSGVEIVETLTVRAEGELIRRGIFRDFPTVYVDRAGRRVVTGFELVAVTRDGRPEPFHTERRSNGQRIYVGDAEVVLPPGLHTYRITYRSDRQLGFFEGHDELYWNVTGNGWSFPVDAVSAAVLLPDGVPRDRITVEAYTGPAGAQGRDWTAGVENGAAVFRTTRSLAPHEGLTIVTGWPKGHVTPPGGLRLAGHTARDAWPVVAAAAGLVLLVLYYAWAWNRVGRDPPGRIVVPHYEMPEGQSPASLRYLTRMRYDDRCFAAGILGLAVQGLVRIEQQDKGLFGRSREFALEKIDVRPAPALADDERVLFDGLFAADRRLELVSANHARVNGAKLKHEAALKRRYTPAFFRVNGGWHAAGVVLSLLLGFVAIGLPLLWGGFHASWFLLQAAGWVTVAVVLAALLCNGVFGRLLKAPTVAGRAMMDRIAGFRLFLEVAEGDDLAQAGAPSLTSQLFERNLPAALALGVEQRWAERFAAVFAAESAGYSPHWYQGSDWDPGNVTRFSSGFGSSFDGAISSASSAPGTSSGGGGGGSSGGGGGGGGGGGW